MLERYTKAFNFMMKNEGGFSDHPADRGGATLFGVSSKFFPQTYNELQNATDDLERQQILFKFYHDEFWNPLYDQIRSERLAVRLFDLGVNLGVKRAVRLIQQIAGVTIDGVFGKQTLRAVNLYDVYGNFIAEADKYYRSLDDFPTFGKGWINRLYRETT